MPLSNCSRCGQLFNKITSDVCKKCLEAEDELLRKTQDYLRQNRNASKVEVLMELELEPLMLEKWIKENRVNIIDPEQEQGKRLCVECGREVKGGGTICRTCQLKKLTKPKPAAPGENKESSPEESIKNISRGMHFKKK
ncbi:MAG: hypothetical protein AB1656_06450 [Candidatus Omnitrophota bacterium]